MKKIFYLFILLFFFQHSTLAQDRVYIDSLITAFKKEKQDTIKADILYTISKAYWGNNPEKSIDYANRSLGFSKKIGYPKGIANAYNSIGWVTGQKGEFVQALAIHKKALKIFEKLGYKRGIGYSRNNIGETYRMQGNYPEALKNHFASLKVKEEIDDKFGIAMSYNNIGIIYHFRGNYKQAIQNYRLALKIRKEIDDKNGVAVTYSNIGTFYLDQNKYREALKNYFASLAIVNEIGDKDGVAHCFTDIGSLYYKQGNYPEALKNNFEALKIREEINDKTGIATSYNSIGANYLKLRKYQEANEYLNKGLAVAQEVGSLEDSKYSYDGLSQLNDEKGNYKEALTNYKLFITIRDSLVNNENTQKITQMQIQYDYDKKMRLEEIKTAKLKEEERRKQNIQYALIAVGILIFIVLFLLISHTIIATTRMIRFVGVITLLIVFEFFNLVLHPLLGKITHHSTLLMLIGMVCIASLLVPMHHKIEKWATNTLIEKNRKIRLANAKKTIEELDETNEDEDVIINPTT